MNFFVLFGWVAAGLTIAGSLPQMIKAVRTKSTKDVSMGMLVLFLVEFSLWSAYGFYMKAWPLVIGSGIPTAAWLATIILKLKYDRKK